VRDGAGFRRMPVSLIRLVFEFRDRSTAPLAAMNREEILHLARSLPGEEQLQDISIDGRAKRPVTRSTGYEPVVLDVDENVRVLQAFHGIDPDCGTLRSLRREADAAYLLSHEIHDDDERVVIAQSPVTIELGQVALFDHLLGWRFDL